MTRVLLQISCRMQRWKSV